MLEVNHARRSVCRLQWMCLLLSVFICQIGCDRDTPPLKDQFAVKKRVELAQPLWQFPIHPSPSFFDFADIVTSDTIAMSYAGLQRSLKRKDCENGGDWELRLSFGIVGGQAVRLRFWMANDVRRELIVEQFGYDGLVGQIGLRNNYRVMSRDPSTSMTTELCKIGVGDEAPSCPLSLLFRAQGFVGLRDHFTTAGQEPWDRLEIIAMEGSPIFESADIVCSSHSTPTDLGDTGNSGRGKEDAKLGPR